jgi:hypothetical protein
MIPKHLESTWKMLQDSFPEGVSDQDYLPLLKVLYENMSDGNLADVVSRFTGRERGMVYNDVLKAGAGVGIEPMAVERVRERLAPFGLADWLKEP